LALCSTRPNAVAASASATNRIDGRNRLSNAGLTELRTDKHGAIIGEADEALVEGGGRDRFGNP
jgi:hypothetical protein